MEKKNLAMKVLCLVLVGIMVVPAFLLTLSTGTDGELTWMNFAGLAWLVGLALFVKMQK